MNMTLAEIASATGSILPPGVGSVNISGVSTDSRDTSLQGKLFVALVGGNFDGHNYIDKAIANGAAACLTMKTSNNSSVPSLVVKETAKALGDIALAWRKRFSIPIYAVTGTAGKTTTKELLAHILGQRDVGLKTSGNFNNLIGLPKTVFQLNEKHSWAVLEMGMSMRNEIRRLAEIARPQIGLITNVGEGHLETLDSIEGVARAKGELFISLPASGYAIVNIDDPHIATLPLANGVNHLTFSMQGGADVTGSVVRTTEEGSLFDLNTPSGTERVMLPLLGRHQVLNAIAAAAAAMAGGIDSPQIASGLETVTAPAGRMNLIEVAGVTIIDDCYNANPISMHAALDTLPTISGKGKRYALLADMLELGSDAEQLHIDVGVKAAQTCSKIYLTGTFAQAMKEGAMLAGMPKEDIIIGSVAELTERLSTDLNSGDTVLIKGSRGMRLETSIKELVDHLKGGN